MPRTWSTTGRSPPSATRAVLMAKQTNRRTSVDAAYADTDTITAKGAADMAVTNAEHLQTKVISPGILPRKLADYIDVHFVTFTVCVRRLQPEARPTHQRRCWRGTSRRGRTSSTCTRPAPSWPRTAPSRPRTETYVLRSGRRLQLRRTRPRFIAPRGRHGGR